MVQSTAEIVRNLDLSKLTPISIEPHGSFNEIHQWLTFFRPSHYDDYVPTSNPQFPDFDDRLDDWMANVSTEEDQARLLELASKIVFLAKDDISALHLAAMNGSIYPWVVDGLNVSFAENNFEQKIKNEIHKHTWYTSITDSMQITGFCNVNHLGGVSLRSDWKTLASLGDKKKVIEFLSNQTDSKGNPFRLNRIVILEDYVGTGSQMEDEDNGSVSFAAECFPEVPILLCPLLICPVGADRSRCLAQKYSNVTFSPVIEIKQNQLISPQSIFDPSSFEFKAVKLCKDKHRDVVGDRTAIPQPHSPWGFGETGSLVVMYTNTPDNSLPIIYHESDQWSPLFPRSSRVK